jgi:hypothetical protein
MRTEFDGLLGSWRWIICHPSQSSVRALTSLVRRAHSRRHYTPPASHYTQRYPNKTSQSCVTVSTQRFTLSLSLSLSLLRVSFWCRVDAVTPCNLPRGIYFCVGSKCWLVSHSSQSFENISAEKMTTSDDYTYWISFPAGARTSDEFTLNYSSSENLFVDHNSSGELSLDGERTSLVQWDDWDQSLWTAEQRQLLERGAIPPEVHITLGVLLTLIVLFGVAANSSIFYVFAR